MTPYSSYTNIKQNHPSDVVFVKVADLYITYGDGAIIASQVLGTGLTLIPDLMMLI